MSLPLEAVPGAAAHAGGASHRHLPLRRRCGHASRGFDYATRQKRAGPRQCAQSREPAYGGDDAEDPETTRRYAPRSALLLGRVVSLLDFEAAAAGVPGVLAVTAECRWERTRQRPVAKIWYLGDAAIESLIIARLRALAEPDAPLDVEPATPRPAVLALQIAIDPRRSEETVLAKLRSALLDSNAGLLAPERVGVGQALFRSRIFAFVLSVDGVLSVTALTLSGRELHRFGVLPGAGRYFDFTGAGAVILNGKAAA